MKELSNRRQRNPSVACGDSEEEGRNPSVACGGSREERRNPSVTCGGSSEEERRNPSVTFGDSSPVRGAFSKKPPLEGEVARSAGGVSSYSQLSPSAGGVSSCPQLSPNTGRVSCRQLTFTIEDVRKRGLIWDGHSLPYNPNLVEYARSLRKDMTKAERKLWYDFLRSHEQKFYRQRPIDHFIADFYCSECSLIIELDGSQHYTPNGLKRDAVRSDILALYGLEIVRFTNADVLKRFDAVCKAIDEKLRRNPSVACGDSEEKGRNPSVTCGGSREERRNPSVTCGSSEEERRNPSVTFGDSSPSRGAFSEKPPLEGEVARSAGGVSSYSQLSPSAGGVSSYSQLSPNAGGVSSPFCLGSER